MTQVLDKAPVVLFPCVVVEDLFYRFLLAFEEYVADLIKTSEEAGVDLYLQSRCGGIVVGGQEGRCLATQCSKQRDDGLRHFLDGVRAQRRRGGIDVVWRRVPLADALRKPRCGPLADGGDKLGDEGSGAQGGARWKALHDGLLMLGYVRVFGWDDVLEGEDVAVQGDEGGAPYLKSCGSSADSYFW